MDYFRRVRTAGLALAVWLSGACGSENQPAVDAAVVPPGPVPDAGVPEDAWVGRDLRVRDAEPYERPPASSSAVTGHSWAWADVGLSPAEKSMLRYTPGTITASTGGAGLDGAADSFGWFADKLHGDGEILARLRSVQMADPRSIAGVMIRAAADPGAPSIFLGTLADVSRGGRIIVRRTAGAMAESMPTDVQIRVGQFLRIRRVGKQFTFYRSVDRTAWVKLGAVELDLPVDVLAGVAISAGKAGALTTTEIDNLRLVELDAGASAAGFDFEPLIPGVALGGRASIAGGEVSLVTNGEAFITTAEIGAALLAPIAGAQTITARVDSLGMAPKARVGLTFREGGPGRVSGLSRHALISVDAAGKVAFQRRDRLMNFDPGGVRDGMKLPLWLRLARYDDPVAFRTRVRGSYSTDGTTFVTLDTVELPLADPMMVGLLATSGEQRVLTVAKLGALAITPTTTPIEAPAPVGDAGSGPADAGDAAAPMDAAGAGS
jgi:hypothetical protein